MASSSIPSSNPVSGRSSMPSLRKLRRSSSREFRSEVRHETSKSFHVQRSTLNVQRSTKRVPLGRWALSIGHWVLFYGFRRVKGAWWPSRSSKPSSVGNGRGRFDSYPLRPRIFDGRWLMFEVSPTHHIIPQKSNLKLPE